MLVLEMILPLARVLQRRSLMTNKTQSRSPGLPHAVFLQRVTEEPATSPEVRLGQGAFLALRFVDLLSPDREPPTPDVFRYQWAATERYCAELAGEGTEASHLSGIVRATGQAHAAGDITLVAPALFAYALYLEHESHLEEASDALETMIRVGQQRIPVADRISAWWRLGRVRRLQTEFDLADAAFTEAGRLAREHGDELSVLLSRVGHCNVLYFRGNLAGAELAWRAVLADAVTAGCREAEAQAEHGLGNILMRRGQAHEGVPHLWRSYRLYEDETTQARAMGDLGLALLSLGEVEAAERALQQVLRFRASPEVVSNAMIELMNCASFRRDRVSFERWRERIVEHDHHCAHNIRADYHLKAGIGFARFENFRRAEAELMQAHGIAQAHDLNEMVFRIERMMDGLKACGGAPDNVGSAAPDSAVQHDSLREVSASLAALES
jgi:tetratricopeptide (TPR) repeat protein